MLLMRASNPQFVEHAILGFLVFRVAPMLPRACTPELGVKPFESATRSHDVAVSVIPTTAVIWYGAKKKAGGGPGRKASEV